MLAPPLASLSPSPRSSSSLLLGGERRKSWEDRLHRDCRMMGGSYVKTRIGEATPVDDSNTVKVMRDGKIVQSGKYDELLGLGTDIETLVAAHDTAMELVEAGNNNSHGSEENGPKSPGGAPFSPGREAANGSSDNKFLLMYVAVLLGGHLLATKLSAKGF
ncbi:unnamed protein product [Linum tenue]|uniref:Uncharacterized protein n=1 Tax=Linum tenue TaxID=586396 RepID=A0AAV0QZG1_9ROSI|nr:unnamed protein product [Linum tenue]